MQKVRLSGARTGTGRAVSRAFGRLGALRWVALALGVVLLGAIAAGRLAASASTPAAAQTVPVRRGTITSTVSTTGTAVPLNQAKVSFRSAARVTEVYVKPGDAVVKDQPLARLDTTDLALKVSQSRAQLSTAQAKLASLKAGSRAEEVRAAQLQLDAARAKLAAMEAGGRPEEIASARSSLESARAKLSQLEAPPAEADVRAAEQAVAAAQASLQKAEADLAKLRAGPTPEDVRNAELDVERAKNSLWSAQLSRDGTCGRGPSYQCDSANASVASAETGVTVALNNLAKLQAPAKPEDLATAERSVASAQAQLSSAQARLEQVKAGASPEELAAARAAVTQAEQSLILRQQPYTEADLMAQRQAVAQAEANLAAKQTPYTEVDLLQAQASVDQAKAQLDLDEYNLANAVLVAPFDGVVAAVGYNVGEIAASGASITLVDPKQLRLDVNVDETDIARIEVGQRAEVTFDSIPGRTFAGQVTSVAPSATLQSGVATYLVTIGIPEAGPVKPGMTGNASIVYGEKSDALLVPNRAIRTQGRSRVVDVLVNGQRETRQVKTGVTNDQMSEVTEGLAEGEEVVIQSTRSVVPGMGQPANGPVFVTKPGPGG